ncbi:MAG: hypothetical protein CL777_04010 [Chloroflexi bacterium]|nr:hypothetical protein [Chloroflexota bacterium]
MTYNGCTTTKIFCRPNCPPGRRTKPENRVFFSNPHEAMLSGFRACKVCTPLIGAPGPWKRKIRVNLVAQK